MLGKPLVANAMADPSRTWFVERLLLEDVASLTQAPLAFAAASNIQAGFANLSLQIAWTVRRRLLCAGRI
ncbi:MAG: hypothetical protein WAS21_10935 [Geminicoccaceae bacterium]